MLDFIGIRSPLSFDLKINSKIYLIFVNLNLFVLKKTNKQTQNKTKQRQNKLTRKMHLPVSVQFKTISKDNSWVSQEKKTNRDRSEDGRSLVMQIKRRMTSANPKIVEA